MNSGSVNTVRYVGFWARVFASLVDTILLLIVLLPLLFLLTGSWQGIELSGFKLFVSIFLQYIFPIIAVILFWVYREATPGKMLIKAHIVDVKTLQKPSTGQCIGRYFGYYVSTLALFLGFIWVGFDKRKQGWHDKLAGTVVIYK